MSATMRKKIANTEKDLRAKIRRCFAIVIAKYSTIMSSRQKIELFGLLEQSLVEKKVMWIRQNMIPGVSSYTPKLAAELLLKYIGRNDEELEQIATKHSEGKIDRHYAYRETIIRRYKKREQKQFDTCGIEIPDISNPVQCKMLRTWNGKLRFLRNFRFRRFGKAHLENTLQKIEEQSRTCHYINPPLCLCKMSLHENSTEPCICCKADNTESSDIKNEELNSSTLFKDSDAQLLFTLRPVLNESVLPNNYWNYYLNDG